MTQTDLTTAENTLDVNQGNTDTTSISKTRFHYMDNLRAIAMLLGIFLHAALAYGIFMDEVWLVSDPQKTPVLDGFMTFVHLFRMPLFFVIAGFFTHYLIQSRGIKATLKNRALRILLPFIIFLPLLTAATMAIIFYAINTLQVQSPLLNFIGSMMQAAQSGQQVEPPPISTMHLWFLFNLMLFIIAAAICAKINMIKVSSLALFTSPKVLLLVFPLLFIPALASIPAPIPSPERIYPELWSFGFYGLFFLFGWTLFINQSLIEQLQPYCKILFGFSIAMFVGFSIILPEKVNLMEMMTLMQEGFAPSGEHMLLALLEAYMGLYLTITCLLIGRSCLNHSSQIMRYLSDSSYWVYLIHLPILLLIQYHLHSVDLGPWMKFFISSIATLAIGLISYTLLVRWSPIGWMLNGRKIKNL